MADTLLATRYITAFSLSVHHQSEVLESLHGLLWLIANDDTLMDLLRNPIVAIEQKVQSVQSICAKAKADPAIIHFLSLLIQKNRVSLLKSLATPLQHEIDRSKGQLMVTITTAVELDDTQKSHFVRVFSSVTGKTVIPTFCVKAAVLGGFKAEYDNTLLDGTLRHTLSSIENALLNK